MSKIASFYIPIGIASLLAAFTHVIVNSVLARSDNPTLTLSSYALALTLALLFDIPTQGIRQTSTKFSQDQTSFKSVVKLATVVCIVLLFLSFLIAVTPVGYWVFKVIFGAEDIVLNETIKVYQFLSILCLITTLRNIYQAIIINHLRTFLMTIGTIIRLCFMIIVGIIFVKIGWTDGRVGAIIFMTGICIETLITAWEGKQLTSKLPSDTSERTVMHAKKLLPFYLPLLSSSIFIVMLNPALQNTLNLTDDPALAIAAYSVALQLFNLVAWFCGSLHQTVLQFYERQPKAVIQFILLISIVSPTFLLLLSFDLSGGLILQSVLGLEGALLEEVKMVLKFLAIQSVFFPWIEFFIGKAILSGVTKPIMIAKCWSVMLAIVLLLILAMFYSSLNAKMASIVTAVTAPIELFIIVNALKFSLKKQTKFLDQEPNNSLFKKNKTI